MPVTKLTPENNNLYMQERMEALMQAVPEAFADGKINWETLRELLGELEGVQVVADADDEAGALAELERAGDLAARGI